MTAISGLSNAARILDSPGPAPRVTPTHAGFTTGLPAGFGRVGIPTGYFRMGTHWGTMSNFVTSFQVIPSDLGFAWREGRKPRVNNPRNSLAPEGRQRRSFHLAVAPLGLGFVITSDPGLAPRARRGPARRPSGADSESRPPAALARRAACISPGCQPWVAVLGFQPQERQDNDSSSRRNSTATL